MNTKAQALKTTDENELAKAEQAAENEKAVAEFMPESYVAEVTELDRVLKVSRQAIAAADGLKKAIVEARAMNAIRAAFTDSILNDIMLLQGSALGFKTDKIYAKEIVRDVAIEAGLHGAQFCGNEFNIIAKGCYLTKEFMRKKILAFPGITRFECEFSPAVKPAADAKTALVACRAEWVLHGEVDEVVCQKPGADGGIDSRVVVPWYQTSGMAQLQGIAESRLYRLVVKKLTGLNVQVVGDVIDGQVVEPYQVPPKGIELELDGLEVEAAAAEWKDEALADIGQQSQINDCKHVVKNYREVLAGHAWPEPMKTKIDEALISACDKQVEEIRKARG